MLNKTVRKALLETKENRKNLLVEKRIIENRFNLLLETLSNDNQTIEFIFWRIISESNKLRRLGLNESVISEQETNFFSSLMSMFGGGIVDSFKEYGAKWIIENIMDEESANSFLGQLIIKGIGNLEWSEITKLFTDCSFLSHWIAKTVIEAFIGRYQEKKGYGGVFADTIRNSIIDAIDNNEVVDAISKKMMNKVCGLLGQLGNKMEDTYQDIKKKVVTT